MRHNGLRWMVGGLAVALIALSSVAFSVREGTSALVMRFGRPVREIDAPGLAWKLPWPIEKATTVDRRAHVYSTRHSEVLTRDKKNVILMSYAVWRVADPLTFHRALGSVTEAEAKLEGLLIDAKTNVMGGYDLSALVSTEPGAVQVDAIEAALFDSVASRAAERYGIRVDHVGFKRVSLPEENLTSVFNQMRAERARQAAEFRAEGERRAQELRADTDRQVAEILAGADEEAAKTRGGAVAEAQELYNAAHSADPEFYRFLRSLESLEKLLGAGTSLVLRSDSAPFRLLEGEPEPPAAGTGPPREDGE